MRLQGGIYLNPDGMSQSIRAMHLATEIVGIKNENVVGFDKIGYQKKEAVVSSFAEIIGVHALSKSTDDQVGRIMMSKNPLDFALGSKGYFQTVQKDGSIDLTRDGRFMLNEKGELTTLMGNNVLSDAGSKIVLPIFPEKPEDIKVSTNGQMSVFNPKTNKLEPFATLGVVSTDGAVVPNVDVKQGYTEGSNVNLAQEFIELVPVRRNFEANRQMYIIQSSNLSRAIQELGRA